MKKHLPETFGVGLLADDSDSYHVIIAPQERLVKAAAIMERIGEELSIVGE